MAKGLIPGGQSGGSRTVEIYGFNRMRDAVQAIPVNLKKNTYQASAANIRTVSRKAEEIFLGSIIRHGESGHDERGRQTGKFTFSAREGGAFVGSTFQVKKDLFGFGFPKVLTADRKTNFVWRSLEYGLAGSGSPARGKARSESLLGDNSLFPKAKSMRMPERFEFSSKDPTTSYLYIGKRKRKRDTHGITGKHFIEGAWIESLETMTGEYEQSVVDATKVFGK